MAPTNVIGSSYLIYVGLDVGVQLGTFDKATLKVIEERRS